MEGCIESKHYAAVDIGASSGRVLAGWVEDGKMSYQEVYRFDNEQKRVDGHDCWDVEALFDHVVAGLRAVKDQTGQAPATIGIDTWGVDFVLLDEHNEIVGDTVAYRDARTDGIYEVADQIMDPAEVYARTGIQRQPFNTLYQLLALKNEHPEQLEAARTFLMIPDYLNWRLTGIKANEYTNASTTGMLDAEKCTWDTEILSRFGIPQGIFLEPTTPGVVLGELTADISEKIGCSATVVLPATHDTGSAFLAVPAKDDNAVYVSSGTWSLLGVENQHAITNELARKLELYQRGRIPQALPFPQEHHGPVDEPVRPPRDQRRRLCRGQDLAIRPSWIIRLALTSSVRSVARPSPSRRMSMSTTTVSWPPIP